MVTLPAISSDVAIAIRQAAGRYGLDPDLVTAHVIVESGGNPWAWNPEPAYRYLWDIKAGKPFRPLTTAEAISEAPPPDFTCVAGDRDQEWWGQQASWGLQQVMGALAREHGFTGPYLSQLCDPATCLNVGCKVLSGLMSWASYDVEQVLAAYNGGKGDNGARPFRNQPYATKVMETLVAIKGAKK